MPGSSKQATHRIKVRSIVLATFLLSSVLALATPNVARVEAAPKLNPDGSRKTAPMAVTTSITANKSYQGPNVYGGYGNGFCNAGTVDMGPPAGNVDFFWDAANSQSDLAYLFIPPWLTAGVGRYDWSVAWGFGGVVCYTRTDSFSFNLNSIPANAIVQSASLTYTNIFTSANQSRSGFVNWSGGNMFIGYTSTFAPTIPSGAFPTSNSYTSPSLPVSTVQTWITNRTSGSLWNSIQGDTGNWQIVAQDVALNVTYILDTTPPTTTHALSGTLGNNGYYKSAVALALAAVDTESGVASTKLDGSTYTTPLIITTEGTTTHSYYSTDVAGNVEVTKTVSVKIDTVAPATTASLTGLMGLNSWFVGPVSVSLAATDATSGVASSTLNGSTYTAPVSFNAQGTTTLNYFSTDNAGNNETTHNASFKIDTVAPTTTSSLSGTMGTNGWYTSAVTVTLNPTDATSGVGSTVLNGSTYTAPVSFSTQGTNTLTYRSTDNAGNSESNQTTSFKIDTVVPIASITSHTNNQWVGGVVTLSGSASDATSGVASVAVDIDGAGWNTASGTTSWSTTWNASALPDASSHTIQVRATDAAGNVSSVTSLTLQVDNAPPTAELIVDCPAMGNDNWCRDSVTVRLSGSDAGVGVQSLTYSYDGKTETLNATRASFVSGIGGVTHVSLYATDKLGKNSTTQTKEIKIDGAIPNIKFNGGDKSTLNIEVTDGESGIARWTLQVFDSNNNPVYWKELTSEQRGNISWDGASVLGGTYFVEIFARDNAGLENHLGRTAFTVSLITLPLLFPTATATTPAPAPRPQVAVVIQSTPIPTVTPPIAIAQLSNNPTIQQPNNPPLTSNIQPPVSVPKEVTIQIPPAPPPNPVTPLDVETAVPILGMLLGAILAGSFILNADQRTQIALAILVLLLTLTGGASWLLNHDDPQTLDVPLRTQDPNTVYCGPASLGMAFDYLNRTPATSHQLLDTNHQPPATSDLIQFMKSKNLLFDFGTGVEELAYAARLQGYEGSYYFSDWDMIRLKQELHEGRPVLTPIKLDNYKQPVGHFLTVTGFSPDEQFVIANDPLKGEVHIPVDEFNQAWQANGARGVVVAPKPIPTIPESTLPLFAGVGAAAALAALAALGTARKGLGAGRTDEGESTWADYSWYEPPAPVQDTWFDTQTEPAPAPQDTWFDSQVYDEGPHEQAASAPSSDEPSHGEMIPDAGVDNTPVTSTQVTQTTEPGWGAKDEVQQRPPEIKTVEDAEKKAQADAEAALARFMARHDEALERSDNTPTDEDYYATLKRLQEAEEKIKEENQKAAASLAQAKAQGDSYASDAHDAKVNYEAGAGQGDKWESDKDGLAIQYTTINGVPGWLDARTGQFTPQFEPPPGWWRDYAEQKAKEMRDKESQIVADDPMQKILKSGQRDRYWVKPRVYIMNGINSQAPRGQPDPYARSMEYYLESYGADPKQVTAINTVYNTNIQGNVPPVISAPAYILNSIVNALQVFGEFSVGEFATPIRETFLPKDTDIRLSYTDQVYKDIQKDIYNNPLVADEDITLIAHSGGGAIAANLAEMLERLKNVNGDNVNVGNVVLMGSPMANTDKARQHANVIDITDEKDFAIPAIRSEVSRVTIPLSLLQLLNPTSPIPAIALVSDVITLDSLTRPHSLTDSNVEWISKNDNNATQNPIEAHGTYWTSQQVLNILREKIPSLALTNRPLPQLSDKEK